MLQTNICVRCGAYVDPVEEESARLNGTGLVRTRVFTGSGPTGVVLMSASAFEEHLVQTSNALLLRRKLMLVLDLDHTIVHATKAPRFMLNSAGHVDEAALNYFYPPVSPTGVRGPDDVQVVNLTLTISIGMNDPVPFGGVVTTESNSMTTPGAATTKQVRLPDPHLIKLRPGVRAFLKALSEYYDIYVYTMGTRSYADAVVNLIDPHCTMVRRPVVSGVELGERVVKRLDALLPCDRRLTVVLDDRVDVWRGFESHVLQIHDYAFFPDNLGFEELYNRTASGSAAIRTTNIAARNGTDNGDSTGSPQPQQSQPQTQPTRPALTPTNAKDVDRDRVLPSVLMTLKAIHHMFYEKIDEEVHRRELSGELPPLELPTQPPQDATPAKPAAAPKRKLPSHVVAKLAKDALKAQEALEQKLREERMNAERQRRALQITQLPDLASAPIILRALKVSIFCSKVFALSGVVPRRSDAGTSEREEELKVPLIRRVLECGGEASNSKYILCPNIESLPVGVEPATAMIATSPFTEKVHTARQQFMQSENRRMPPVLHASYVVACCAHWGDACEQLFSIFDAAVWIAKGVNKALPEQVHQAVAALRTASASSIQQPESLYSALNVASMSEWWGNLQSERLHHAIDSIGVQRANFSVILRLLQHSGNVQRLQQLATDNLPVLNLNSLSAPKDETSETSDAADVKLSQMRVEAKKLPMDEFDWNRLTCITPDGAVPAHTLLSFTQAYAALADADALCDADLQTDEVKRMCKQAWEALDIEKGKIMLREEEARIRAMEARKVAESDAIDEEQLERLKESLNFTAEEIADLGLDEDFGEDDEEEDFEGGKDGEMYEGLTHADHGAISRALRRVEDEDKQLSEVNPYMDEEEEEERVDKPDSHLDDETNTIGVKRGATTSESVAQDSKRVQTESPQEVWDDIEF